jgi:transcriptional regulator of acetoin/glycerol metabolism
LDAALELAFPTAETLPTVADLEAAGVRLGLKRLDNNMLLTAKRLGVSRATLYRRAAKYA